MAATNNYRHPLPAEEATKSQANKLRIQQQHHHQFASSVKNPVIFGVDTVHHVPNSVNSTPVSVASNSSLRFKEIVSTGRVELFDDPMLNSEFEHSISDKSNTATHHSHHVISKREKPLSQHHGISLPQIFSNHSVDRDRNKVLAAVSDKPLYADMDDDSDVDSRDIFDPTSEKFLMKIVSEKAQKSSKTIRSSVSGLYSRNSLSTYSETASINTEKAAELEAKLNQPPLHIFAESLATSDDQEWIDFLKTQSKLSFASFSAIDYIDAKGNAKKHRVKAELVGNKSFDGKKLVEMNKVKKELERLGIVDESIIDFKTKKMAQSASDSVLKMRTERKELKRFVGSHSVLEDKYFLDVCQPGIRKVTSLVTSADVIAFADELNKDSFVREFQSQEPAAPAHTHNVVMSSSLPRISSLDMDALKSEPRSGRRTNASTTQNTPSGTPKPKQRKAEVKANDLIRPIFMGVKPKSPVSSGLNLGALTGSSLKIVPPQQPQKARGPLPPRSMTPLDLPTLSVSDDSHMIPASPPFGKLLT
jgi:hypothetical protein